MAHEGTVVADRFEIERIAGRGGMGTVYRAIDRATGQAAALKILHDEAVAGHRERFAREARLLSELTHPAFVRYLDFGATADGLPYLAMEWLDGEDLTARLRRDGLTAKESVALASRVASALGAAHARGIVHRDVKPSNLFLVDNDAARVKVLDFGIARIQTANDGMTRTGTAIGTPKYMAPEQARGSRDLDARADVFSLGCVLFELLTGQPPFNGQTPAAVLAKILMEDAPRLASVRPELPDELDDVLGRMLAKEPAQRPRDGTAVAAALALVENLPEGEHGAPPYRPSAVTVGEQRLVCVVFASQALEPQLDASSEAGEGSYTIVDNRTPLPAATATTTSSSNRARVLAGVVAAHGGRAEILADGSVIVTVLGQGAATDQAARAARCALAMREVIVEAPMALAIGRAVVGDRIPLGELIDRATGMVRVDDRLDRGRRPVRVDDVAAGLLDVRFSIAGDEHGLVLSGERDVADLARTLLGRPTPCVGRERELGALTAIFEECVAEPRSHAVVVTAAAGVGKSRLRHELVQRIASRGDCEVWIGRGDPMSAGAPFGLLGEALRRACGIVDGEPLGVRHLKLKARVGRRVPKADQARVTEFLGELVGAPVPTGASVALRTARQSPELIGDQMLRACEDFLAAECMAQPVLLVLEDLQWGDLPTVRFVDAILRQLPDSPLMVLALARPEVDSLFPRLWADRGVERIHLAELTKKAAEKLVRETLGADVDGDTVVRLVERAAGNAFYLEELIRSVAEGYGERMPETIVAMAQARIEALEPEARHVLRAASVFGQMFWRGGVAALVENTATEVADWLGELVTRELITARRESRFAHETEYTFRHALVREAAYAMLTDRDRMHGHRLAGEWLESRVVSDRTAVMRGPRIQRDERVGDVEAVALAEHFLRGGDPRRAVGWYRQAAEQALEGDDLASAIERAERAIACIRAVGDTGTDEDDQLVGSLRQLQSGAHAWRGEYVLAIERGEEALERLPRGSHAWLVAATAVLDSRARRLEHAQVVLLCEGLAELPVTRETQRFYANAIGVAMPTLLWHSDPELVHRLFVRLDGIERDAPDDPATLAQIHSARSWRAMSEGDFAASLQLDIKAERCFSEVGDLRHACQQRANIGYNELMLGAFAAAERSLGDAITSATRIGLHQVTTQAQHNLGLVLAYLGRLDEARAMEQQAANAFHAQGNRRLESAAHNYLAMIDMLAGDLASAQHHARLAMAGAHDDPNSLCYYQGTLARALLLAGDAPTALAEATSAMQLVYSHGNPEEGEHAIRRVHAEALAACGHHAEADAAFAAARARLEEVAGKIKDYAWRASFLAVNEIR